MAGNQPTENSSRRSPSPQRNDSSVASQSGRIANCLADDPFGPSPANCSAPGSLGPTLTAAASAGEGAGLGQTVGGRAHFVAMPNHQGPTGASTALSAGQLQTGLLRRASTATENAEAGNSNTAPARPSFPSMTDVQAALPVQFSPNASPDVQPTPRPFPGFAGARPAAPAGGNHVASPSPLPGRGRGSTVAARIENLERNPNQALSTSLITPTLANSGRLPTVMESPPPTGCANHSSTSPRATGSPDSSDSPDSPVTCFICAHELVIPGRQEQNGEREEMHVFNCPNCRTRAVGRDCWEACLREPGYGGTCPFCRAALRRR